MITLYGNGFLGREVYSQAGPSRMFVNSRDSLVPQSNEILYTISTVDNYNIYTNPYLDIDTNLRHLIEVLESCRHLYGSKFFFNFVSSWFVYGKTDYPAKETSVCNPTGFYSVTKRCAEQLLESYCSTFGIPYRILRMASLIGTDDKKVSVKKNAFQYMLHRLVHGLPVHLYEGPIYRDIMDVRDAASAILLVLERGTDTIYNIGNGTPFSMETLILEAQHFISFKYGVKSTIERTPVPEFHKLVQVRDMYLDNSRLRRLGYGPRHNIRATMMEIINAYAQQKV